MALKLPAQRLEAVRSSFVCRGRFPGLAAITSPTHSVSALASSAALFCCIVAPLHHYCTAALLHRCTAAHQLAAIALHCALHRLSPGPSSASPHRPAVSPVSAARTRLAVCRRLLVRLWLSPAVFYHRSFLRQSAFSFAPATRSSFCAARARARRPYLYDSLAPLPYRQLLYYRVRIQSYHRVWRHFWISKLVIVLRTLL